VSDRSNPILVSEVVDGTNGALLNGAWGIETDGNYVYVTSQVSDVLVAIDVSNPSNPSVVDTIVN